MLRPPIGRILAYWRAERRTIRQGLVALLLATVGNIAAGVALGKILGTLERFPGMLVLLPAAVATRGSIFGALGSRLGTSIHAGLFSSSLDRQGVFFQNVYAAGVLTLSVSAGLGLLAKGVAAAFGLAAIGVLDLVVISVVGGVIASVAVGAITAFLAVQAHHRDWDLDSVAAPMITAIGDVVTIPALFVATYLVGLRWTTVTVGVVCLLAAVFATYRGLVTPLAQARRAITESLPILLVSGTLALLAGLAVEARLERFAVFPALLVLVPPLLSDAGALGAILSSRLASKLHLGALAPSGLPRGPALLDASVVLLFGVWLFALVGIGTDLASGLFGLASPGMPTILGISLVAGLAATVVSMALAYYAAVASYRIGLDPDNHGIPVITSTMDLVGVACFVGALAVFGIA